MGSRVGPCARRVRHGGSGPHPSARCQPVTPRAGLAPLVGERDQDERIRLKQIDEPVREADHPMRAVPPGCCPNLARRHRPPAIPRRNRPHHRPTSRSGHHARYPVPHTTPGRHEARRELQGDSECRASPRPRGTVCREPSPDLIPGDGQEGDVDGGAIGQHVGSLVQHVGPWFKQGCLVETDSEPGAPRAPHDTPVTSAPRRICTQPGS